jgi:hypothetical protein
LTRGGRADVERKVEKGGERGAFQLKDGGKAAGGVEWLGILGEVERFG